MVVKNNQSATKSLNQLNVNNKNLEKKVSSGMKINGAADDASGFAISERMRVCRCGALTRMCRMPRMPTAC